MKFRSARTLVYSRAGDKLLACNFLTKSVFECSVDLIAFLGELGDWQTFDDIVQLMPDMTADELRAAVDQLVETSAMVVQGSALARMEAEFRRGLEVGHSGGDDAFLRPGSRSHHAGRVGGAATAQSGQLVRCRCSIRATTMPARCGAFPSPRIGNDLIELMARRRTVRSAASPSITLKQLSDCLFAGMGITGATAKRASAPCRSG